MGVLLAKESECITTTETERYKKEIAKLEKQLMEKDREITELREYYRKKVFEERAEYEKELNSLKKELEKEVEKVKEYEKMLKQYAEFVVNKALDSEFVEFVKNNIAKEEEESIRKKYMLPEAEAEEEEKEEEYEEEVSLLEKVKKAVRIIRMLFGRTGE